MTTLDELRDAIPDYAKDLKLNLGSVLAPTGAPGLNDRQISIVARATAIASRNALFAHHIEELASAVLDPAGVSDAHAAAARDGRLR